MKNLLLAVIAVAICGCSAKSPYDVSSQQVQQHIVKMGGTRDLAHLPPGAVKHERLIKKGDVMPDGSIATHDGKIVTVDVVKHE